MQYTIKYRPEAEAALDALSAFNRGVVLGAIDESLRFEPTVGSKNRRPVAQVGIVVELGITWQLRVGAFRVFYDVDPPSAVVVIRVVRKGKQTTEESLR